MKALSIGQSAYQITAQVDGDVQVGTETEISNLATAGGGSAPIVAYVLGKYKTDSYIGSVIGDDSYGTSLKKELEQVGVHTEYMETSYGKSTTVEFIMLNSKTKQTTTYRLAKEPLFLKKTEFQLEPDLIFIDGYDYGAAVESLNKYGGAIKVLNAERCNQEVFQLAKYCDYIIATKEFAEWMTKIKLDLANQGTFVTMYNVMLEKLVNKQVIVTLGANGALYSNQGQIKILPGLKNNIEDTTGAGDIFKGALCHALLQKYTIEQAVTFANIAAGLSIQKIGAFASVPDISEIMTMYNQKFPNTAPAAPAQTEAPAQVAPAPAQAPAQAPAPAVNNPAPAPQNNNPVNPA